MSDIIIGVVGRNMVDEHTKYAPDALAVYAAANAAHHMMKSVFPDRLQRVGKLYPDGTLPITVDSVAYVGLGNRL